MLGRGFREAPKLPELSKFVRNRRVRVVALGTKNESEKLRGTPCETCGQGRLRQSTEAAARLRASQLLLFNHGAFQRCLESKYFTRLYRGECRRV